jgi:integrase
MERKRRIGLRDVRQLREGETIWDGAVSGFGARRQKGKTVSYILKYRTAAGRQRWYVIGRHGSPWTPDDAREEAIRLLGEIVGPAKADPAADKAARRKAVTVSELCDAYLSDAKAGRLLTRRQAAKRPSTLATDRGRIEDHIKPLLGRMAVAAATRADVEKFMHDVASGKTARKSKTELRKVTHVRGGKGAATRTMGLLGSIFAYAVVRRMRPDNPVRGVVRFGDGKRERRLTDSEYLSLGKALKLATPEAVWPAAVAATRFLALTGWRRNEALGLRWDEIDLKRRTVVLPETKTGRSIRPLSHAACDLLQSLPRSNEYVFAAIGGGLIRGFPQVWARKLAKLDGFPTGITPHTLRHSFASLAGDLGFSELTIAALIGHQGRSVTSRYVHAADTVLLAAADAIADRTATLMGGETKTAEVVLLRQIAG